MRGSAGTLGMVGAFALVTACRPDPSSAPPRGRTSEALAGVGDRGLFRFELTLTPDPPIVGQHFRVVTNVRDAVTGAPVPGAHFELSAAMPEHGHGMTTSPEHHEQGLGAYVSVGMKFHMAGGWFFSAEAEAAGVHDRITLRFEQPPRFR
jgi:hypothetical protein